jgi:ABC-2 type transport system permease protein
MLSKHMLRYFRLFGSLARFSFLGEMAFRGNFLLKIIVELSWLGLVIYFYDRLFRFTGDIAGWSRSEYFFFIGCFYILESINEALFLGNFGEFAELVRTGNLDFVLLKPVDEQFLISFRNLEWSSVPNMVLGGLLLATSLHQLDIYISLGRLFGFIVGMMCGVGMAYSFLLMLASTSVWLVRNQSLYELWWLFTSLMRYPKEIFNVWWARPIGMFFTFVFPVLLTIHVPASAMVKTLEPGFLIWLVFSTIILLGFSRWVFRRALRSYRSASS